MGIVSTQFYVYFDDFFETIRYASYGKGMPITWQQLVYLTLVLNIEPEPVNETTVITSGSEEDHLTEQNPIFFAKEHEKKRS